MLVASVFAPLPGLFGEPPEIPQGLTGEALHKQITAWIDTLGADAYAEREAARAGLRAYAQEAHAQLQAALAHPDAEVVRSAKRLLARAGGTVPATTPATLTGRRDVARLGRVRFTSEGEVSVREALDRFGREHGGSFELPEEIEDRRIEVDLGEAPWFDALGQVLERAGLQMTRGFDASGQARLQLRGEGSPPPVPTANVGPFRVRVVEVVRRRALTRDEGAAYVLVLDVAWSPRIEVLQLENARVVSARRGDGQLMEGPKSGRRTYGLGRATYQRRVDVHLRAPAQAEPASLSLLEVEIPLRLRHGLSALWLRPPERLPQTRRGEGEPAPVATFERLEGETGGRRGWLAEVEARLPTLEMARTAHVLAESVTGTRVRMHVAGGRSGSADGTVHLTARSWQLGSERPRALGLAWFSHEEQGLLRVRLSDVPLR